MSFAEACVEASQLAVENGKEYFVYHATNGGFMVSHQYDRDWLFRAYPGGRKVVSLAGSKLIPFSS